MCVEIDHAPDIASAYFHIALPEAYAYHAKMLERTPELYSEGVRTRLQLGREIPASDYLAAQRNRARLRIEDQSPSADRFGSQPYRLIPAC